MDVSVGSLAVARSRHPELRLVADDLRALPVADGRLAGIVAFHSAIHLPRADLPAALAGTARALRPGGSLLVSTHGGDGEPDAARWFGHDVSVRATLVGRDDLVSLVEGSGLVVRESHLREPYGFEHQTPRLYVWATRP